MRGTVEKDYLGQKNYHYIAIFDKIKNTINFYALIYWYMFDSNTN